MSENPSLQERYAAAWCDVKQPELDGANPHYKSRYATLAAVQGCIRKACAKHGIAYAQRVKLENGEALLVSEVVGAGDALHLSDYPVQFVPNPQSNGSMLTYAKRQLASIDWGICGDEDDDGQNAALPPRQVPRQPPQNQMDQYRAALVRAKSRGVSVRDAMEHVGAAIGKPPESFSLGDIEEAVRLVDSMQPHAPEGEVEEF